jgi:hypothetical protein
MKIKTPRQTIIDLTYLMSNKERFAFVNFSKSALLAASGRIAHDKKPPKYFTKSIQNSLDINDKNYMKSVPEYILSQESGFDIDCVEALKRTQVYDAGTIENLFITNKYVFDCFVEFYIRYTKTLVVSFHDKKSIQNIIGSSAEVLHVPYNDFYDKLDSIFDSIKEYDGKVDYCILDCPVLSSAIASKIWNKTNMSILDFGKVFTISNK